MLHSSVRSINFQTTYTYNIIYLDRNSSPIPVKMRPSGIIFSCLPPNTPTYELRALKQEVAARERGEIKGGRGTVGLQGVEQALGEGYMLVYVVNANSIILYLYGRKLAVPFLKAANLELGSY